MKVNFKGKIIDVHEVEELRILSPNQTQEEYEALKESIIQKGFLPKAIEIAPDGTVLDGHHRFKALKELDIPVDSSFFEIIPLETKEEMIEWVLTSDIRRHLNDFQKVMRGLKEVALNIWKNLPEDKRESFNIFQYNYLRGKQRSFDRRLGYGEAKRLRRKLGVSEKTYYRAKKILESGDEDLIREVSKGLKSINAGYQKVKKSKSGPRSDSKKKKIKEKPAHLKFLSDGEWEESQEEEKKTPTFKAELTKKETKEATLEMGGLVQCPTCKGKGYINPKRQTKKKSKVEKKVRCSCGQINEPGRVLCSSCGSELYA